MSVSRVRGAPGPLLTQVVAGCPVCPCPRRSLGVCSLEGVSELLVHFFRNHYLELKLLGKL